MNSRSDELWGKLNESTEKFDYFICGITGALFGYIAQTYTPQKIDGLIPVLMPLSLLFLIVSFYAGVRRIQYVQLAARLNQNMLFYSEMAGKLTTELLKADETGATILVNQSTGETFAREVAEQLRSANIEQSKKAKTLMDKQRPKAAKFGKLRDGFLVVGFIFILLSRVLQPYHQSKPDSKPTAVPSSALPISTATNPAPVADVHRP